MTTEYWNKPCAAHSLLSYRYRGNYGWVMIGARDNLDALREAGRSVRHSVIQLCRLEIWNGASYQRVRTL